MLLQASIQIHQKDCLATRVHDQGRLNTKVTKPMAKVGKTLTLSFQTCIRLDLMMLSMKSWFWFFPFGSIIIFPMLSWMEGSLKDLANRCISVEIMHSQRQMASQCLWKSTGPEDNRWQRSCHQQAAAERTASSSPHEAKRSQCCHHCSHEHAKPETA